MLTVLPRTPGGRVRLEFEWHPAGDARPVRLCFSFPRGRSAAGIRAGCAGAVALALSGTDEAGRAAALRRLNRDFDRAVAAGWI